MASTEAFSVAGITQLNIQGWAGLGFSAQVVEMSVCNTGTKSYTSYTQGDLVMIQLL